MPEQPRKSRSDFAAITYVMDAKMLDAINFISAVLGEGFARSTPEGTFWWTASAAPGEVAVVVHKEPNALDFAVDIALDDVQGFENLAKRYAVLGYVTKHGLAWNQL